MSKIYALILVLFGLSTMMLQPGCDHLGDDDDASGDDDDASDDDDAASDDDDAAGDDDDAAGDDDDSATGDDDDSADDDDTVSTDDDDVAGDDDDSASDPDALELSACGSTPPPADPFDIDSLAMSGDTLEITVGYSGGCAKHVFEACWNEMFLTSLPKQVVVVLSHDANGDQCEAYIMRPLTIDLTDIRTMWEMGSTAPGQIVVNVGSQSVIWDVI